jgi:hypothetical protein
VAHRTRRRRAERGGLPAQRPRARGHVELALGRRARQATLLPRHARLDGHGACRLNVDHEPVATGRRDALARRDRRLPRRVLRPERPTRNGPRRLVLRMVHRIRSGPTQHSVARPTHDAPAIAARSRRYGPDNLEVVDQVRVPAQLGPGAYVVQWRWDCEESSQVWQNCAE